ncbi:MAG: ParB N-terminal domain-containing protein [Pseudobutyrivibrio sp.]|nr:ParB N-terminal domain-containing protein [Pseudobutyrivibrio sp.]
MGKSASTEFDEFIANEIKALAGVAMPVKAGLLSRIFIRSTPCKKLHPNPDDEFSIPEVGPSYRIISEYEKKFINNYNMKGKYYEDEPILVEKIRPDGYMILNGHHRWAAALRLGYPRIPIRVINVTHEKEIREIINNSKHDKRVTLDLDEVVFWNEKSGPAEKGLSFPLNKIYKEKLRLGIPALFNAFNREGYDIWIYSSKFYSTEYIKALFKGYHVHVTGIVTGTSNRKQLKDEKNSVKELYSRKYVETLHIDNDVVLMIDNKAKDFREYSISGDSNWSKAVLDILEELGK